MKYYFICYSEKDKDTNTIDFYNEVLVDIHPLKWLKDTNEEYYYSTKYSHSLISFQEISEEEYYQYKED